MKSQILFGLLILANGTLFAQYPSGEALMERIDRNMSSRNRVLISKMIIHGRRATRTITSKSWSESDTKSFTEYISPAREKGTKMLKLKDQLWMYSPSTDRTIQISGHMLRQSVMGSDLSYEDMMEDKRLLNVYYANVTGEETVDEQECWIMELTAKVKDVAYHSRKIWVDKSKNIPLKQELYAKKGKLLKRMEFKNITRVEGRWYPTVFIYKDVLKKGKGTEFIIDSIKFDVPISSYIFTKAALRK